MLEIAVVDSTAESRGRIVERLTGYLSEAITRGEYIPRVAFSPFSPRELRFHSAAQLCILGRELISQEMAQIAEIRKALPNAALLAEIPNDRDSLGVVEQLARLGVDDILRIGFSCDDFLRKLIFLSKKQPKRCTGKILLVDSAKGGVGVTTLSAALGEMLAENGKRVALIDLDSETQDLTRFLGLRPCVSENLWLLLTGERPPVADIVEQCALQVWGDNPYLYCVPPVSEVDGLAQADNSMRRRFVNVIEAMLEVFEFVIVDTAGLSGSLVTQLYSTANQVFLVLQRNLAAVSASLNKAVRLRSTLAPDANLFFIDNGSCEAEFSTGVLACELERVFALSPEHTARMLCTIRWSRTGRVWPASGSTLYSLLSAHEKRSWSELEAAVLSVRAAHSVSTLWRPLQYVRSILVRLLEKQLDRMSEARRDTMSLVGCGTLNIAEAAHAVRCEQRRLICDEEFNPFAALVCADNGSSSLATSRAKSEAPIENTNGVGPKENLAC